MSVKDLGFIDLYDKAIHVFYKDEDQVYHLEFLNREYTMELSPDNYDKMISKLKELGVKP